jgi:toxin ParE1/3/4
MPAHKYRVELTDGAQADLESLHDYVAEHGSPEQAEDLLDALLDRVETLEQFPERGAIPKELAPLGITEFRQLLVPPYRLIYRVIGKVVFVSMIADGRRDMQALLQQRLLGS